MSAETHAQRIKALPLTVSQRVLDDGHIASTVARWDIDRGDRYVYLDNIRHFVAQAWCTIFDGVPGETGDWDRPLQETDDAANLLILSGFGADDGWKTVEGPDADHVLALVQDGFLSAASIACALIDGPYGLEDRLVVHVDDLCDAARRKSFAIEAARRELGRRGFIYVIRLSTGIVKVGRARDAEARLRQHATEAGRYGVEITDRWVSRAHGLFEKSEAALIAAVGRVAPLHAGREYFRVDFDEAVRIAKSLTLEDAEPRPLRACLFDSLLGTQRRATERWGRLRRPTVAEVTHG